MATGRDLVKGPNGTVWVEGIQELTNKLRAAEAGTGQMQDLMHSLGLIVMAHADVPKDNGTLDNTLRAGRGKTKAVVRAGYARQAHYAGVVHYGDPHRNHRSNPFLVRALLKSHAKVVLALADGVDDILKKNNLA